MVSGLKFCFLSLSVRKPKLITKMSASYDVKLLENRNQIMRPAPSRTNVCKEICIPFYHHPIKSFFQPGIALIIISFKSALNTRTETHAGCTEFHWIVVEKKWSDCTFCCESEMWRDTHNSQSEVQEREFKMPVMSYLTSNLEAGNLSLSLTK